MVVVKCSKCCLKKSPHCMCDFWSEIALLEKSFSADSLAKAELILHATFPKEKIFTNLADVLSQSGGRAGATSTQTAAVTPFRLEKYSFLLLQCPQVNTSLGYGLCAF
jgi:hypothetical protein